MNVLHTEVVAGGAEYAHSELLTTRATAAALAASSFLAVNGTYNLGEWQWRADDGHSMQTVAGAIRLVSSSGVVQGRIPSSMRFLTSSATSALGERMTLTGDGSLLINASATTNSEKLHVAGRAVVSERLCVGASTPATSAALHVQGTLHCTGDVLMNNTSLSTTFLPLAGGTLTGHLSLPSNASPLVSHATRRDWVESHVQGRIANHTHSAANITSGILPVARGGTGTDSFTAGRVLFGAGTSALSSSAKLTWTEGTATMTVTGSVNVGGTISQGGATLSTLFLASAGGTVTGHITLPSTAPSASLHAVPKAWVEGHVADAISGHNHDLPSLNGVLPVPKGGTGASSLTAGRLLVGGGTSAVLAAASLHWNAASGRLGVGTTSPQYTLDVAGALNCTEVRVAGTLIDSNVVLSTGATLTGPLLLHTTAPATEWEAAAKGYVDAEVATRSIVTHTHDAAVVTSGVLSVARGGTGAGILDDGAVLVGSGAGPISAPATLRWIAAEKRLGVGVANPAHAADVDGDVNASGTYRIGGAPLSNHFLSLALGGTVMGRVTLLAGAPTLPDHAAPKSYVDASITNLSPASHTHDLSSASIEGVLPVARGGTGATAFEAGRIVYGTGVAGAALGTTASLTWNASTSRLGVNTASPAHTLDVAGDVNYSGVLRKGGVDVIATLLPLAGGKVTGNLETARLGVMTPVSEAHAVNVVGDVNITNGRLLYSGIDVVDTLLPLTGGALTGALQLSGAPSLDMHAATKKYVDDVAAGKAEGAHTHDAADITVGVLGVGHGGTGAASLQDARLLIGGGAGAVQAVPQASWDATAGRLSIAGAVEAAAYTQAGVPMADAYVSRTALASSVEGALGVGMAAGVAPAATLDVRGDASFSAAVTIAGDVNIEGELRRNGVLFDGGWLETAGGTMTGALLLHSSAPGGDPLEAASKGFVQAQLAAAAAPLEHEHGAEAITSGVLPAARGGTGLGTVGVGHVLWGGGAGAALGASASLVWSAATSRLGVNTASPAYTLDVAGSINFTGQMYRGGVAYEFVPTSGATLTGALTLHTSLPSDPLHAASKGYVDASLASAALDAGVHITAGILPVARGGTGVASFTASKVLVGAATGGGLAQAAGLHWNATASRLGVGTASPAAPLHVNGGILMTFAGPWTEDSVVNKAYLDQRLTGFLGVTTVASGGTNSSSVVANSLMVSNAAGDAIVSNPSLRWDPSASRLGVGVASPSEALDVVGKVRARQGMVCDAGIAVGGPLTITSPGTAEWRHVASTATSFVGTFAYRQEAVGDLSSNVEFYLCKWGALGAVGDSICIDVSYVADRQRHRSTANTGRTAVAAGRIVAHGRTHARTGTSGALNVNWYSVEHTTEQRYGALATVDAVEPKLRYKEGDGAEQCLSVFLAFTSALVSSSTLHFTATCTVRYSGASWAALSMQLAPPYGATLHPFVVLPSSSPSVSRDEGATSWTVAQVHDHARDIITGNVGVGVTLPQYRLEVDGVVRASQRMQVGYDGVASADKFIVGAGASKMGMRQHLHDMELVTSSDGSIRMLPHGSGSVHVATGPGRGLCWGADNTSFMAYVCDATDATFGGTLNNNASDRNLYLSASGGTARGVVFRSDGQNVAQVTGGGDLYCRYVYAQDLVTSSDRRLKAAILPVEAALAKVRSMNGVTFSLKDAPDGRRRVGLIAQEVLEVVPEAVVPEEEGGGHMRLAYGNLVGVLVEALKEEASERERLEERISRLEARLGALPA